MSIERKELLNSIESLPEELISQVIDYMEYIKFMYVGNKAPSNLIIKDNKDLTKKIQEGIDSTDKGETYSLEETFEEVQDI